MEEEVSGHAHVAGPEPDFVTVDQNEGQEASGPAGLPAYAGGCGHRMVAFEENEKTPGDQRCRPDAWRVGQRVPVRYAAAHTPTVLADSFAGHDALQLRVRLCAEWCSACPIAGMAAVPLPGLEIRRRGDAGLDWRMLLGAFGGPCSFSLCVARISCMVEVIELLRLRSVVEVARCLAMGYRDDARPPSAVFQLCWIPRGADGTLDACCSAPGWCRVLCCRGDRRR